MCKILQTVMGTLSVSMLIRCAFACNNVTNKSLSFSCIDRVLDWVHLGTPSEQQHLSNTDWEWESPSASISWWMMWWNSWDKAFTQILTCNVLSRVLFYLCSVSVTLCFGEPAGILHINQDHGISTLSRHIWLAIKTLFSLWVSHLFFKKAQKIAWMRQKLDWWFDLPLNKYFRFVREENIN